MFLSMSALLTLLHVFNKNTQNASGLLKTTIYLFTTAGQEKASCSKESSELGREEKKMIRDFTHRSAFKCVVLR